MLRGAPLIRQGDYVHALPPDAPPLDGIRTVKPGLCLLRAGRSHVQPMRALAMAARPDLPEFAGADFAGTALRSAELDAGRTERFLAGERPELDGERGWTLATYRKTFRLASSRLAAGRSEGRTGFPIKSTEAEGKGGRLCRLRCARC